MLGSGDAQYASATPLAVCSPKKWALARDQAIKRPEIMPVGGKASAEGEAEFLGLWTPRTESGKDGGVEMVARYFPYLECLILRQLGIKATWRPFLHFNCVFRGPPAAYVRKQRKWNSLK